MTGSLYIDLKCDQCRTSYNINELNSFCIPCNYPLTAIYDLSKQQKTELIDYDYTSLWRYKKLLPIFNNENVVSLQEGFTPLYSLEKTQKYFGLQKLYIKDESYNPTGSFKARGMSVAISKAKELGVKGCCTPTAGNAGSALAAYCAKAEMKSKVYMPIQTPKIFSFDTSIMGSEVIKVDGTIRDAGLLMQKQNLQENFWDVSTMKEPFRLEGKKTMGFEIAEQLKWQLPDVILYPTGGGTGLIGIWKAFQEMKTIGMINEISTKMIAVQMNSCNPIVQAFNNKKDQSSLYEDPGITAANGLRVPKPFADKMILNAIYASDGYAIDVEEKEMISDLKFIAHQEGLFLSPEGAALISALKKLIEKQIVQKRDRVLIINTGSGYKYVENLW
jgi:threonine synthase